MSWKEFPYTTSIVDFETSEWAHQPTLEVKIIPSEGSLPFTTRMVVDSGATETLLDAEIGKAVGLDVVSGVPKKVGGITGSTTGYEHRVQIDLVDLDDVLEVDVIFVPNMGASGLLGQDTFFSRYDVRFEKRRLKFAVEVAPSLKNDF